MKIELLKCGRCGLTFVAGTESEPKVCPNCRNRFNVPRAPVMIAGQAVEVKSVTILGTDDGLLDLQVRRGLDVLKLGARCRHGMMIWLTCSECGELTSATGEGTV